MGKKTLLPSQRLELLPEVFGVAYPSSKEELSRWRPAHTFSLVIDTPEELSILCPEQFIPAAQARVRGLRVLVLQPNGFLVCEILRNIAEALRVRSVPATSNCHFESDLGCIAVRGHDVEFITSLLRQEGHVVARRPEDC